jgi:hypothetical protein
MKVLRVLIPIRDRVMLYNVSLLQTLFCLMRGEEKVLHYCKECTDEEVVQWRFERV